LDAQAAERLQRAYAPRSRQTLGSAIRALAQFAADCPARLLFKRPRWHGDSEHSAWNEWTFILFAVYLTTVPSRKTKEPLAVKSVETYIALLKGHLGVEYEFDLMHRTPRLQRLLARLRENDPRGAVRKKRRALRMRHLVRLWERVPAVRLPTPAAVNAHALLVVAWHVLARGGELAPAVSATQWDARLHPTRADVEFHVSPHGRRSATVWLRPLKKHGRMRDAKIPQYVAEFDGGGADAYAALQRLFQFDPVPEGAKANTPLFRRWNAHGVATHATVAWMRALVRLRVRQLGYSDPYEWGAHSCRIGGATDLTSTGRVSPLLLQAKGRWASDIGRIYSRMTRRAQLAASELMYAAKGRDLEELLPDFTQAA